MRHIMMDKTNKFVCKCIQLIIMMKFLAFIVITFTKLILLNLFFIGYRTIFQQCIIYELNLYYYF